jgi:serine/threonine protein phosphatase PrpC
MRSVATLNAAGRTDPGLQRPVNEDRLHVDASRGLFIVIDGVGGQAAGGKAADVALSVLRTQLERETAPLATRVREAITIANNEIRRLADTRSEWNGMACVVTVVVVDDDRAIVGHVGDTRLYKLSANRIEKVTRDHSPVGEREDAGELSEREAMRHPRRNEVYRDVGSDMHEAGDPGFIDVGEIRFEPDSALLLCSDGLTDLIESSTIDRLARQFAGDPDRVVSALIDAAKHAGGKDNVTVVYIEGDGFKATGSLAADWTRRLDDGGRDNRIDRNSSVRRPVRFVLVGLVTMLLALSTVRLSGPLPVGQNTFAPSASSSGRLVVRPGESIAAALKQASPGGEIIVEPGEYREAIFLVSDVRLVSRIPGGAVLRLPANARETDAATIASGVAGAALVGFRIVGDATTPLGTGLLVQDSELSVIDADISGAANVAIDIAGTSQVSVMASDVHDNPGAAFAVRSGASARITHNVFQRNGVSPYAPAPVILGENVDLTFAANVFYGITPGAFRSLSGPVRTALTRDNWFLDAHVPRPTAPTLLRGQRGQRGGQP